MAIKYFCDSCGRDIASPVKAISVNISRVTYFPDLCEECKEKIIKLIYQHSGDFNHDDKE